MDCGCVDNSLDEEKAEGTEKSGEIYGKWYLSNPLPNQ